MFNLPMKFEASTSATSGIMTGFEAIAEDFTSIPCAIPPQFNGPGKGYSPEDLLAISVATCLVATFKVFAEKSAFAFERIEAKAELTIDRVNGVVAISKIEVKATVFGVQDQEKGRKLLDQAAKNCLVSNALKIDKQFSFQFQ